MKKIISILLIVIMLTGCKNIFVKENPKPLTGKYNVSMEIENYGVIKLELDADSAPITVKNFKDLVESGFYDGLSFHRVAPGFVIQGGDPSRNGTGGSSHTIKGEFSANGYDNPISHERGVISMARSNDYNSASSQFFIVLDDSAKESLDGMYAAFGHVTEGMDIVDKIAKLATSDTTLEVSKQPIIKSVTIEEA